MKDWVPATDLEKLREGEPVGLKVEGTPVVLVNVQGEIHALLNQCPHLGCTLHRGKLEEYEITCPCHDWVFDVRTGEFREAPQIKIPVFPVKVEEGKVLIKIVKEET